jgi:hypothetical protein
MAFNLPTFEKLPRGPGPIDGSMFVTGRHGEKTYCHDNFSYYFSKQLIPCAVMSSLVGIRYALQSKLVDS